MVQQVDDNDRAETSGSSTGRPKLFKTSNSKVLGWVIVLVVIGAIVYTELF